MELAPAPVNFSEGVLVLQSSPSLPPGADDEQEREPEGLTLVELEDLQATASSAAAQAIAPKRSLNSNLWALSVNCCSSRRAGPCWTPAGPRGRGGTKSARRDSPQPAAGLTSLEQWIS